MYKIVTKRSLNPTVTQMEIEAPLVANKAKPGQFIILRVDEEGERIPLTVAGTDPSRGTVKIIFQIVGGTTEKLNHKNEGEFIEETDEETTDETSEETTEPEIVDVMGEPAE